MNEMKNEIMAILNQIKNSRVAITIQNSEFNNDDIYVRGQYETLLEIKEQINKYFTTCETNFVHGCYVPFPDGMVMCEDWAEDLESDAWCTNDPCLSPKVLEICIPIMNSSEVIEKIFKNNMEK